MPGARDPALIRAFANVVKEARLASGLTQEALALKSNVDRTYVGLLENGRRQPSLSTIFALATGLGVNAELLIRRTGKFAPK